MKMALLGGTGATGLAVIECAVTAGFEVTALVRNAAKLSPRSSLQVMVGDVLTQRDLRAAIDGVDVVVSTLGMVKGSKDLVCSQAVTALIPAMIDHGPTRLIALSAYGAGNTRRTLSVRLLRRILDAEMRDKDAMEVAMAGSGLDWTIVRPGPLTNKKSVGYRAQADLHISVLSFVSRRAVAACIVDLACAPTATSNEVLVLTARGRK